MSSQTGDLTAHVYTELGAWGMPTIDADGLAALALLRFVGIPFTLTAGASPSMTAAQTLPVIVFDKGGPMAPAVCAGLPSLVALMASDISLPDLNRDLTPFMVAESTAFFSLVQFRFGPARLHEFFRNDRNYADIYHTLLEKERGFPLNRVLPMLRRREILRSLQGHLHTSLYFNAGIALAAMSTRLGDTKKFFYGDKPTVLDAVVFGYLASVMYTPLPVSNLRVQISKFKNLVDFVKRISQAYFSTDDEARIDGHFDADELATQHEDDVNQRSRTATQGDPSEVPEDENVTEEDKQRKRWNRYFVMGSIAAFGAHVLLGSDIELDIS